MGGGAGPYGGFSAAEPLPYEIGRFLAFFVSFLRSTVGLSQPISAADCGIRFRRYALPALALPLMRLVEALK